MSHIINESGAETDLFKSLSKEGIHRFSSIDDMISFKRSYLREIEKFREREAMEIEDEIENLSKEVEFLRAEYEQLHKEQTEITSEEILQLKAKLLHSSRNFIVKINRHSVKKQLLRLEANFDQIVNEPLREFRGKIDDTIRQLSYLSSNREKVIAQRSAAFVSEIEYIVDVLTELAPVIYGAIGELKAIELLRKLPDNYYVINDYRRSFHRPLHMKGEDDWIYSIQLDHVVIGPTGVFVIETKYWSQKSIANSNLFSPVKQLRRGGFALFVVINNAVRNYNVFNNHWGSTQISVVDILLMMNATTNEQFQFVKVLTESNLCDFITHRPSILSNEQVKCLVEDILLGGSIKRNRIGYVTTYSV